MDETCHCQWMPTFLLRWVYSEIAPQRPAPTPQDSRAVVINGLLSLRDGILEYDGANKANVFDSDGALVHELGWHDGGTCVRHQGSVREVNSVNFEHQRQC